MIDWLVSHSWTWPLIGAAIGTVVGVVMSWGKYRD